MKAVWILELILKCIVLLIEAIMLAVFSPFIALYAWLRTVAFRSLFVKYACKGGLEKRAARLLAQELKLKNIFNYRSAK